MKKFSLPDMQINARTFCTYIINGKPYNFRFIWCDSFFYVDIYILQENSEVYILKGFPIVPEVDLISRIKNPDVIEGKLYIKNKFGEDNTPTPEIFNSDFELVYENN